MRIHKTALIVVIVLRCALIAAAESKPKLTLDEFFNAVSFPALEISPDGKYVAAICHAPWLLIETGIAKGRKMTSYKSIKTDVANAGAKWEDAEVVVDQGVITSRNPGDLEAFSAKIIEEVKEGRHTQRSAA